MSLLSIFLPTSHTPLLLPLLLLAILTLTPPTHAFGAGTILKASKLKDSFWRHGDIAEVLFALGVEELFVRRVYFGNWLCDFSQALDAGTLSKVPRPIIQGIVSVLAFMEFGFSTREFEVTPERLGVYRPEIHIDNPKGYPSDAGKVDSDLRGPVSQDELMINRRTGMKNYIAGGEGPSVCPSTKETISRILHDSIMLGRNGEEFESLRLLGVVLHALEDFMAHSNYLELAIAMTTGYPVFSYVGDGAFIDIPVEAELAERWTPSLQKQTQGEPHTTDEGTAEQTGAANSKPAAETHPSSKTIVTSFPPLVTGTFGVLDFLETVTGAATDHFAARNLSDLSIRLPELDAIDSAVNAFFVSLKAVLALPGFGLDDLDLSTLVNRSKSEAKKPRSWGDWEKAPGEFYESIKPILVLRDTIARQVLHQLEKVPLVRRFLGEISSALDKFVFALMAPFLKPVIMHVQRLLSEVAQDITAAQTDDRRRLFAQQPGGSDFSDPSHALLCKDHFTHQLNPLAGFVACHVTEFAARRYMAAVADPTVPIAAVVADVMSVLHHPMLPAQPKTPIQADMYQYVEKWWRAHGPAFQEELLAALSREGVEKRLNHGVVNPPSSSSSAEASHSGAVPLGGGEQQHMYLGKKRIDAPSAGSPNPIDAAVAAATNLLGKGVLDVIKGLRLGGEGKGDDDGDEVPTKGLGPIQGMGNLLKDGIGVLEKRKEKRKGENAEDNDNDNDDDEEEGEEDGKKDSKMGRMADQFKRLGKSEKTG